MKIGLMAGATEATGTGISDIIEFSKKAEERGFDSIWLANIFGIDAVMACALAGAQTQRIELATAVTPSYPRHPLAMAQQALTANVACNGRFTMGIGLSHKLVIEDMMGLSYARPAAHMHEYLQVLSPLLRGEPVSFSGEEYRVNAALNVPGGSPCSLLVAALGPRMLKLAGEYADGTITWVTGAKTLANHIIPTINESAAAAGRPTPRIVCGLPIAVTDKPAEAKAMVAESLKMYGALPSYRAMLDREGVAGPADVALIGSASEVAERIAGLREIGVTDFNAAITPTDPDVFDNTMAVLEAEIGR